MPAGGYRLRGLLFGSDFGLRELLRHKMSQGTGPSGNPATATNRQVGPYNPTFPYQKGDMVTSDQGGWWVCVRTHISGQGFTLKQGQSSDTWHYSVGASGGVF